MERGALMLVLHAHLPFVRHPEYPSFMEEDWLYEAITETYLPLLGMLDRLEADGVAGGFTMTMTPPLCEMLADDLLKTRYAARLDALIAVAEQQRDEVRDTDFDEAGRHYVDKLHAMRDVYRAYSGDLIAGFRRHLKARRIEIVTCTATHGLMPLIATLEGRRAQLEVATASYRKHFEESPRGIWLAECAYAEGVDVLMRESGLVYFFGETHSVNFASPRPKFGHYRPVLSDAGVAVFPRDPECSKQVWSAEEGYPGDARYREFYRDLGWEAPDAWVEPIFQGSPRRDIGLKYHRITGSVPLADKAAYVPSWAEECATAHAEHFVDARLAQLARVHREIETAPLLVAPYDAELFGHWWYEGPLFLEAVVRRAAQAGLVLTTPVAWLGAHSSCQIVTPSPSSWGDGGWYDVWLNEHNAWIYPHLQRAEQRLVAAVSATEERSALAERVLSQAARELLLAQSSDWAFIVTMDTTVEYAVARTTTHLDALNSLLDGLARDAVDEHQLSVLEQRDSLFAELDYRVFRRRGTSQRVGGVSVRSR